MQGEEQNWGGKNKHLNKILNLEAMLKVHYWSENNTWKKNIFSLGSLCKSLRLILVTESFNEKGRSILCCPMLFRILAEWENDGVNWHLHNCKEKGCNYISKSPANLHASHAIQNEVLIIVCNSTLNGKLVSLFFFCNYFLAINLSI